MPDLTPATQTEDPPPEDGWRPDLALLRARLDRIDDNVHDLLMRRAEVIEDVARSGKAAAFRPGREASILRRLLARHTGGLPARTLVRMWREMLAGTTAMQTNFTVGVFDPTPDGALASVAREHFGFLTPVPHFGSPEAALAAVRAEVATVAVLPFPADGAAWWTALTDRSPQLHVVARLPFWADRPEHVPRADALVICAAAPDASGHDRSFILTAGPLRGFAVRAVHGAVVEVDGLIAPDDPRLPAGAVVLGGYAIPVAGDDA
jgi:chorismate mutase / prephenate dehydratase